MPLAEARQREAVYWRTQGVMLERSTGSAPQDSGARSAFDSIFSADGRNNDI